MNIGFLMVGISYGLCNQRTRDWRRTRDILMYNTIEPLRTIANVKTFVVTNNNFTVPRLLSDYGIEKYKLLSFSDEVLFYNRPNQLEMYLEGLQLMSYIDDIDFIITTRFDVLFYEKVTNYKIDFNKFNVTFKEDREMWDRYKYVSDAMFAFPRKYLENLIDGIQDLIDNPYTPAPGHRNNTLHRVYAQMESRIGEENINFLFEGCHNTGCNQFFSIMRESDIYDSWGKLDNGRTYVCLENGSNSNNI